MNAYARSPQNGFTIVELLVVIVVIGILASITIVSYNGTTSRANTSSAQITAQNVARKAEAYNAENSRYPLTSSELTADPTSSYYVPPSITWTLGSTQPETPSDVRLAKCGTGSPANQAAITAANLVGVRIYYWTYTGTPNADSYATAGLDTGSGVACPSS
jgi:prepilin-type N-terminal cleavage/methylation domain-containing protein